MPESKKLVWDEDGKRLYTTGIDRVALYLKNTDGTGYETGVAWSGVSAIEESPSGAEAQAIYADNIKYLELISKEDFGMSITAYYSPKEFDACDGCVTVNGVRIGQQSRRQFGLVYRTKIGNDIVGDDYGYEYHICYNLRASVSSKSHNTINDSPEAQELSWEITSTDAPIQGYKSAAQLVIRSTDITSEQMTKLENLLFGTDETDPTLYLPYDLIQYMGGDEPSPEPEPGPSPEPPTYTYLPVDKTTEGYAEKNPVTEGWYEATETEGEYELSADTTVDMDKTYYTRTEEQGEG